MSLQSKINREAAAHDRWFKSHAGRKYYRDRHNKFLAKPCPNCGGKDQLVDLPHVHGGYRGCDGCGCLYSDDEIHHIFASDGRKEES